MPHIKPRQPAPALTVSTLDGDEWRLDERSPEKLSLIVFYRGLHCPVCAGYLKDLDDKQDKFAERGVETFAVSCDDRDRAAQSQNDWKLSSLPIGYGLDIDVGREWGLFVSEGIAEKEPKIFTEPGLFLVRPDRTIYYAAINSMPFGRPKFDDLLGAIDFVMEKDYPARGEA